MSTKPTANDFDPAAVSAALAGTWQYAHAEEPGGIAFFHFSETGRGISFVFVPAWNKRIPLCPWYCIESPTQLRFHIKPDDEGAAQTYRLEGETLSLTLMSVRVERSWLLHRASADEIPGWFHQRLAAFLVKNP